MKKDTSMSKLLPNKKRQSSNKLGQDEHASVLRKTFASASGLPARIGSKRKLDGVLLVHGNEHDDVADKKNAVFTRTSRSCYMEPKTGSFNNTHHRLFCQSPYSPTVLPLQSPRHTPSTGLDLPPSLPKRVGSVENTGLPLPTSFSQQSHNARFVANSNLAGSRKDSGVSRSLRGLNPFWDSTTRVDLPPSYHRHESVSTQLNKMCLSSSSSDKPGGLSPSLKLTLPFQHTVEIQPGVMAKVRGAQETWSCLKRDFYQSSVCRGCNIELTCIRDLDYVLCPTCGHLTTLDGGGGVGLGFTFSDLRRWELGNQKSLEVVEEISDRTILPSL